MLKEALQYLIGLSKDPIVENGGKTYSTCDIRLLNVEEPVESIKVRNLSGIVDYVKSKFDLSEQTELMVHVASPTEVFLYDSLDFINNRRTYIKAIAMLPNITLDRFMSREAFNIQLQACFVQNDDKDEVLNLISMIQEDQAVTQMDNGISQKVVVKQGAELSCETTKSTYGLKPFRTFIEVSQPVSSFILRVKEGAQVALYEADGGAWELNAIHNIRDYFQEKLAEEIEAGRIQVIA